MSNTINGKRHICIFAVLLAVVACCGGAGAAPAKSREPNTVSCTLIKTAAQLQAMQSDLAGNYCLANDIDVSAIANFVPIGNSVTSFTGNFFGNNHIISNLKITSAAGFVGLFGIVNNVTIQDVRLVNAKVHSTTTTGGVYAGTVVGFSSDGGTNWIVNVDVTGEVSCVSTIGCQIGGLLGHIGPGTTLTGSSAAVKVSGSPGSWSGGAAGQSLGNVDRTHASGDVSCGANCLAGGLVGNLAAGTAIRCYATGTVAGASALYAGGLIGQNLGIIDRCFATGGVGGATYVGGLVAAHFGAVQRSHASGPVNATGALAVGGLYGFQSNGVTLESYAVGNIVGTGASRGGLFGALSGAPVVTNSYWDTSTTGQATSAGGFGTGQTTAQLRAALPGGFTSYWAINKTLSYPFLNDADIDFASPLATLVLSNSVYVFLPVGQLDLLQYKVKPHHSDQASLAAVYTMIARAVGITDIVPQLVGVKIDKYFWHDATQTATWSGPITSNATLSPLKLLPGAIGNANVIAQIKAHRLVILRGTYSKSGGGTATHYMLATLDTKNPNNTISTIVANDPWTGWQVEIDPATKMVVSPSNFPLTNFKVNAYQAVTVN